MSGIPYWTMDIGGFCVEKRYEQAQHIYEQTGVENQDLKEWRELNVRWHQFAAFVPLFRSHGQFPYREMYNIAPENHKAYQTMLYFNKLRYRLMPYIYSLAGMTYHRDYTIMRALVMDYANDKEVLNISDQYMFGNSIMVCPVYKYQANSRYVYFPKNNGWYDFYNGKFIAGGEGFDYPAPYDKIPLFVPEGAILPIGPEIQYSDEKDADFITLYVYDGKDGVFTLYEDENVNYNYEKGAFSNIEFRFDNSRKLLIIGDRKGGFDGMLKQRRFNIVFVSKDNAQSFNPDAKGIVVDYAGESLEVSLR